jgi:hypothetical protein
MRAFMIAYLVFTWFADTKLFSEEQFEKSDLFAANPLKYKNIVFILIAQHTVHFLCF